jgi:hypothetical protein
VIEGDAVHLPRRLRPGSERPNESDNENDREPDQPH